jgi:hypothetical protein
MVSGSQIEPAMAQGVGDVIPRREKRSPRVMPPNVNAAKIWSLPMAKVGGDRLIRFSGELLDSMKTDAGDSAILVSGESGDITGD